MHRVLLTRPKEEALRDREIFEREGFEVSLLPTVAFRELDWQKPPLEDFDYLYFGSKRGVEFFFKRIKSLPSHLKVIAVGKKTAQSLHSLGIKPFLVLDGHSRQLVDLAKEGTLEKGKILVPTAKVHTKDIYRLERFGFELSVLPLYETYFLRYPLKEVEKVLKNTDIVIFTSPSTFLGLLENLQKKVEPLQKKIIVAIGKTTAGAIKERGLKVDFIPSRPYAEVMARELSEVLNGFNKEQNSKG